MTPFDRREAHLPPHSSASVRRAADESGEELEVEQTSASIAETRSQISETLDAIEDRLNPETVKAQAKAAVRDVTIGRAESAVNEAVRTTRGAGTTMLETIKQNPIPAAMIGIGLGWLLFNAQSSGESDRRTRYRGGLSTEFDRQGRPWVPRYERYSASRYADYGTAGTEETEASEGGGITDRLQDTAGQAVGQAQDAAGRAMGQVQDTAGRVAGNVQDTMGGLQQSTQQFAGTAQDRVQRLLHDSPLIAGGIALAAGMVVGLALPETEQEKELLGEAHDNFMEQVKESAREAGERIQDAVGQVGEAAQSASH